MNKFTKTLPGAQRGQVLDLNKTINAGSKIPGRATRSILDPAQDVLEQKSKLMRGFKGYDESVGGAEWAWRKAAGREQAMSGLIDKYSPERLLYRNLASTDPTAAAAKRQWIGRQADRADFWAGVGGFIDPGLTGAHADSRYAGLGTTEYAQIQQQRQQALAEAQAAAQGQQAPQQQPAQTRPPTRHHRQHPSQRADSRQQPRLTPQQQHLQRLESDWQQRQRQYRRNTRFE